MKKLFLNLLLVTIVVVTFTVINFSRVKENKNYGTSILLENIKAIGDIEGVVGGGGGNVTCYWTYQTGWFANWHIMTCYSCKPEEVKEFRDRGSCSL